MPKQRITEEDILKAAFEAVREQGFENVNARQVAKKAGCSVQPIYTYFGNMETLMARLYDYAKKYLNDYIDKKVDRNNYFASTGRCNISFAGEEKNLFKFLFLSPYLEAGSFNDVYTAYERTDVTRDIEKKHGLSEEEARKLYRSMMVYTYGIACMIAGNMATISFDEIHPEVDFAFWSFLDRIRKEKK